MKYKTILAIVAALAFILTACVPQATEIPTMTTEPTMASAEPAAAETSTGGIPVTGEATVNVSESTDFGSILVNGEGLSLYIFMADTQNGGTSACGDDDGCTEEWPPLVSQGSPVVGEGVDSTMLNTITREDGSIQVTYNGWPLYTFHEDTAPGDTNGQGLEEFGGLWYLVTPTGEAVQQ